MGPPTNGTAFTAPWAVSPSFIRVSTLHASFLESTPTWVLLLVGFFGVQILAVVLNVLRQLVRLANPVSFAECRQRFLARKLLADDNLNRYYHEIKRSRQRYSMSFLSSVLPFNTEMILLTFSFGAAKK